MIKRDAVEDVLLKIGISAGLKGFDYIVDAVEILDRDKNIKITCLYVDIAKKRETTGSRVERAIRHALQVARDCKTGPYEAVEHYIGFENPVNSASLYRLLLMIKREEKNK